MVGVSDERTGLHRGAPLTCATIQRNQTTSKRSGVLATIPLGKLCARRFGNRSVIEEAIYNSIVSGCYYFRRVTPSRRFRLTERLKSCASTTLSNHNSAVLGRQPRVGTDRSFAV